MNNIDNENSEFWDEMCGSTLAKYLGITDSSQESLKKFDDWYMDFYSYLYEYIPFNELKGKSVLEIGLGYGTVAQKLVESEAIYTGLDIAKGPVQMVNLRVQQLGVNNGKAIQGNILEPVLQKSSFDHIFAIGCLHHTGDLKKAIANCYDLLKEGGKLTFMVYYAYSYRRIVSAPLTTWKYRRKENKGYRGVVGLSSKSERAAYDTDTSGKSAPHTDWISKISLADYCKQFKNFEAKVENIDNGFPFWYQDRSSLLKTSIPQKIGLDLYAVATK